MAHLVFCFRILPLIGLLAPLTLEAQLPDIPLYYEPIRPDSARLESVTWIVGGSLGRGLDAGSGKAWSWEGDVGIMVSDAWALHAGGGVHYPKDALGDAEALGQAAATTEYRINRGAKDVTFTAIAGAGYAAMPSSTGEWNIPVGLGVAYYAKKGPGPMLKLWAVPRWNIRINDLGSETVTQQGVGASGGVTYGLEAGLGASLYAEWNRAFEKTGSTTTIPAVSRFLLALRLRYHI